MLIYGNAQNSDDTWQKYNDYVRDKVYSDFSNTALKESSIFEVDDASYYLNEFKNKYPRLKLLCQKIQLKSGTTQEILHIYIDIAKNSEEAVRKVK